METNAPAWQGRDQRPGHRATLGVARSTIQDNLKRGTTAGLTWPLPGELTDDALEGKLFARAGVKQGMRRRFEPNWADLVVELKKPGVTLLILWEEYRAVHPGGYGCSRSAISFAVSNGGFRRRCGSITSPATRSSSTIRARRSPLSTRAPARSARFGASSFTYAEATWTQTLPHWIGTHVRMFRFFEGVPPPDRARQAEGWTVTRYPPVSDGFVAC
ncbi:transposase [Mesorhizobium sp. M7A.T.Ca.US.000.02.1.1]|uniref:transposase n=1 Tax=Mesorhizobium sp. M7A.T.Ca.US.000.02.1.1 TaxID=2496792 RepID=UPI0019D43E8A|nr:transposase [Mesorhizobium sp. M7A.T.Ca.US.000.02.1.1]